MQSCVSYEEDDDDILVVMLPHIFTPPTPYQSIRCHHPPLISLYIVVTLTLSVSTSTSSPPSPYQSLHRRHPHLISLYIFNTLTLSVPKSSSSCPYQALHLLHLLYLLLTASADYHTVCCNRHAHTASYITKYCYLFI